MTHVAETPPPADHLEQPSTVLMLTDHPRLLDVAPLARRGAAPTLWSVQVDTTGSLHGILATEAQMVDLRDLLDSAIDRARSIERRHRR